MIRDSELLAYMIQRERALGELNALKACVYARIPPRGDAEYEELRLQADEFSALIESISRISAP